MPKLNDMFPSKYLKAADIDQDYEVTISRVDLETLGQDDEKEDKYIVYFLEFDKGLVLNKTNGSLIAAQHGDDTDGWIGSKIVLTVEDVAFQGKIQPAIRVKRPARTATPRTRPVAVKPATAEQANQELQQAGDADKKNIPF